MPTRLGALSSSICCWLLHINLGNCVSQGAKSNRYCSFKCISSSLLIKCVRHIDKLLISKQSVRHQLIDSKSDNSQHMSSKGNQLKNHLEMLRHTANLYLIMSFSLCFSYDCRYFLLLSKENKTITMLIQIKRDDNLD